MRPKPASINAYAGNEALLSYASTKGAIVSFTRCLAQALVKQGIRMNAVAPGPIWTRLIPSTTPAGASPEFNKEAPMGRAGQPEGVAPYFVFLAARDSSSYGRTSASSQRRGSGERVGGFGPGFE
jgi:NAD(P)-dependent dehydrogenase (short-subunit alcohol dehydrogenase family)